MEGAPEIYCADDLLALVRTLPLRGEVCRRDDFFFLSLPPEWQQPEVGAMLVDAARSLYRYDRKVLTSVHALRKLLGLPAAREERWFSPPSFVGLHVSIGRHALGASVGFAVERVMCYENAGMDRPSPFDPTKRVARWVSLRVSLNERVEQVSSCHITIAACGFEET